MLSCPSNYLGLKPSFGSFRPSGAGLYAHGEVGLNNNPSFYCTSRQLQVSGDLLLCPQLVLGRYCWMLQLPNYFLNRADQIDQIGLQVIGHVLSPVTQHAVVFSRQ